MDKKASNEIINNINNLLKNFIKKSEKNIYTIMLGFTHLKMLNQFHLLIIYWPMLKCLKETKKDFLTISII